MVGYPITYGDILEEGNGFTSEMVITEISEYWSNEKNQINKGYRLGLLVFGVILTSRAAFASDSGVLPANNGGGNCPAETPAPGPGKPGSLAQVPTAECGIAMKSGAYWVGFVYAAAVIVGVRIAVAHYYN